MNKYLIVFQYPDSQNGEIGNQVVTWDNISESHIKEFEDIYYPPHRKIINIIKLNS